jgi:hypothetical protein
MQSGTVNYPLQVQYIDVLKLHTQDIQTGAAILGNQEGQLTLRFWTRDQKYKFDPCLRLIAKTLIPTCRTAPLLLLPDAIQVCY